MKCNNKHKKEEKGTDWSNGSLLPVLDQEQTNKQTTKQQPENGINNWFFIITLECKMETLKHMKLEDHCQFEMHLSQARIKFRTAITSSNQWLGSASEHLNWP